MTESDRRFRKNLVAVSMFVGPLLILIGVVIAAPIYDGDNDALYLASVRENGDAHWIGNVVSAFGAMLLPIVMLGMTHLIRVRKRIFGTVAGVVACIGAFGIGGAWLFGSLVEYQMAHQPNQAAMVALYKDFEADGMAPLIVTWGGFVIGLILVTIGLLMARTVPRWAAILLAIATVSFFVSEGGASEIIANVLLFAAFSAIGWSVWKRTPDEWERGDLPASMSRASADREPAPAGA